MKMLTSRYYCHIFNASTHEKLMDDINTFIQENRVVEIVSSNFIYEISSTHHYTALLYYVKEVLDIVD